MIDRKWRQIVVFCRQWQCVYRGRAEQMVLEVEILFSSIPSFYIYKIKFKKTYVYNIK